MNKTLFGIITVFILLIGCQTQSEITCPAGEVMIAGECCEDTDNNSICDEFEVIEEVIPEEPVEEVVNETEEEPEEEYLSLEELEDEIMRRMFPSKDLPFDDAERDENLTGIQNKFNLRFLPFTGLSILQMKREYDYLDSEEKFAKFMRDMYEIDIKDYNLLGDEYLDYLKITEKGWKSGFYTYQHDLLQIDVGGTKQFSEEHIMTFAKPIDNVQEAIHDYKFMIKCTPELLVEIYYETDDVSYGWNAGTATDTVLANIGHEKERLEVGMMENAEKIVEICSG